MNSPHIKGVPLILFAFEIDTEGRVRDGSTSSESFHVRILRELGLMNVQAHECIAAILVLLSSNVSNWKTLAARCDLLTIKHNTKGVNSMPFRMKVLAEAGLIRERLKDESPPLREVTVTLPSAGVVVNIEADAGRRRAGEHR